MRFLLYLFLLILSTFLGHAQHTSKETIDIDNEIQGDLYLPQFQSKRLAILIPGSGPTDRNGNQPPSLMTDTYKLVAKALADHGIAVFTFDKRVVGQLKKQLPIHEESTVFADNVSDIDLIIEHLATRFSDIILIGHSEGSLIGAMAATGNPKVTHFVSIAGQGETIDKILSAQITQNSPFLKAQADEILDQLRQGQRVEKIIPMLQGIFRPSVQPYLISWIAIDPLREIQKLHIPVLILSGDKDLQVALSQGELLHQAYPEAHYHVLEGMNHVLKQITEDNDNLKSYHNRTLPLHPDLVPHIVSFLNP